MPAAWGRGLGPRCRRRASPRVARRSFEARRPPSIRARRLPRSARAAAVTRRACLPLMGARRGAGRQLGGQRVKTAVVKRTLNPEWNADFTLAVPGPTAGPPTAHTAPSAPPCRHPRGALVSRALSRDRPRGHVTARASPAALSAAGSGRSAARCRRRSLRRLSARAGPDPRMGAAACRDAGLAAPKRAAFRVLLPARAALSESLSPRRRALALAACLCRGPGPTHCRFATRA